MIGSQRPEGKIKEQETQKRNPGASNNFSCYFCKKSGHIKKNYMKYKEMLEGKGGKDSDEASTSGKSDKVEVVEQIDEDPCDVLTVEPEKGKYSDTW